MRRTMRLRRKRVRLCAKKSPSSKAPLPFHRTPQLKPKRVKSCENKLMQANLLFRSQWFPNQLLLLRSQLLLSPPLLHR